MSAPHRVKSAAALFAACLFALAPAARARQQSLKLDRIEFKGLERVKEEEALGKSGLTAGQTVSVDDVEAAANRLLESGLFNNLSYKIKGTTDKALLTFEVIERKWTMPVSFDNFVWFTDDELNAAVRRKLPAFDGTAPEAGGVTEQIKQALAELLAERKIEGTVQHDLSEDPLTKRVSHLFSVKGPGLRVCKINYAGARAVAEEQLVTKSGGIFDNDYSRAYTSGFVESNLLPLYHERGYLRAAFSPPKVAPEASPECKGVAVSFNVDEGSIYVWDKAAWEGAEGLTAQELDAALGMRNREVANAVKIARGLNNVRKAYGRKGYIAARVRPETDFDDSARSVSYRFRVTEGPQYHMGDLTITGILDEAATNNLRGRWRLLHKEVYDEGYVEEFIRKSVTEFQKEAARAGNALPPLKVVSHVKPDHDKRLVHVTLDIKRDTTPPMAKPQP
ncbi:MAG TPA: POTRA domain-containing protein [Pyrinomonadaceae bacterium]|nr:POTRA domain-containing protein [Pyrinomonadaceae bacterium]